MKVAIYWEQVSWGGTDTHLLNLLTSWKYKDIHFVLYTNEDNEGYKRIKDHLSKLNFLQIKTFPSLSYISAVNKYRGNGFFPILKVILKLLFPWFFFRVKKQFYNILKNESFDAIISNNGGYPGAWGCQAALIAAYERSIKSRYLLIHHAATSPKFSSKYFENYVDKKINKAITGIITVSRATREKLFLNRPNIKNATTCHVIYNGINTQLRPENPKGLFNHYKTHPNEKLIGIVGKIERYKGHEDLLKAFNMLSLDRVRKLKILVIGKGEKEEIAYLKGLLRPELLEKVIFTGYLKESSYNFINELDLLTVMTKDFEGFGLTLGEAMSMKTPILATNVGAIPEFISHLENGFLVKPESPKEVKEALNNFLDLPKDWEKRAEAAFISIKNFSNEKMASSFYGLLQK